MTTIVTRAGKGSPLTNTEMDTNLTNLNSYKVEQDISGNATITGDVYLTGSGKRITGDFSNATVANRVMFQTSTVNGATQLGVVPNGTSTIAMTRHYGASDPTNTSTLDLATSSGLGQSYISSDKTGTGTYLPMTFYTGGSERMRIDTSGNIGIGVPSPIYRTDVLSDANSYAANFRGRASDGIATLRFCLSDNTWTNQLESRNGSLSILSSGNVVMTTPNGGLGYGTGAGGTVTQATSKSTAVTLNKPTGQITMNNAALAAGATVGFALNNSLISTSDNIILTLQNGGASTGLNYNVWVGGTAAGLAVIQIKNISGVSLSEALVINFAIIKGATS